MNPRVLLVDDDEEIRAMLESTLTFSGFDTVLADGALAAMEAISSSSPDVVVLDVMMPVMDGFELARLIRARDARIPIIFLSARDGVDDRVRGLRLGGDDYLVKPFTAIELIARIEAILRRRDTDDTSPPPHDTLQVADLRVDVDRHVVSRGGTTIELSPTEFRLLELLMRNAGRVLSKTVILQEIWMYDFGGDANVVERFISSLRRKIDGDQPSMIVTVRGFGYRIDDPGAA
ncbi:MAG: DNA-binding response regulator [Microbacterium sp. 71-36]|uniref:response regulator transcription factor n=1 Tax=unclassified Microbacterium TaxID=2609290 RepID=UPI00086EAB57|nr:MULTISPECIES: response regulator transcription factor [unclassified Microbacterium]MBN9211487.1 response regulator transcription factor [Microbacterium sp.]ODT41357.1 MAG: DNA-binding response regulator [Microbacterium sp. SCN 71-17]OJV75202.1 MAG: DNA-binding response regulator [Microbacterium sp. 71-36]